MEQSAQVMKGRTRMGGSWHEVVLSGRTGLHKGEIEGGMKSISSRISGPGLSIALLLTMLVVARPAPVSAGTLTPSNEFSPPVSSGADIVYIAVAGNGTTIYAAGGAADLDATLPF